MSRSRTPSHPVDVPVSVGQFRQTILRRTAGVLLHPAAQDAHFRDDTYSEMATMLSSAVEELRVAEEELERRQTAIAQREEELTRRNRAERRLFDCAPVALLATDRAGKILHANVAAHALVGKESGGLEGKPIVNLVPVARRREFRTRLNRLVLASGAADCRFLIERGAPGPLLVSAAVSMLPVATADGVEQTAAMGRTAQSAPALLWSLREISLDGDACP